MELQFATGKPASFAFDFGQERVIYLPLDCYVSCVHAIPSVMLVDSTRAGKRIPDALSKTVPIWCAVINRAVARRYSGALTSDWDSALYTPPGAVSNQEHRQIENRLDDWAETLVVGLCLSD